MVAQVLYRKWRPQTFDNVVGQQHIVRTLRNALAANDVAHAYLFAGPRGTGKTTTARLLAKAVNCVGPEDGKPCNVCEICQSINAGRLLDLIEIDAASNRGIDDIRDLRAKASFSPSQARYKVYILDEAHMLTTEAFNALLKTLEEPPGHVIFVLVTTEPHRLPTTITSRCQRFDFHRLSLSDIVGELARIADREVPRPADAAREASQREALELIARSATGSLRDAISLLDQVITAGGQQIALERVQEVLGTARMDAAAELTSSLIREDISSGLRLINQVIDQGADIRQFTAQMVEYLHSLLLLQVGGLDSPVPAELTTRMQGQAAELSTRQLLDALRLFTRAGQEIGRGAQPQLPLELALVEAVLDARDRRAGGAPSTSVEKVAAGVIPHEAEAGLEKAAEQELPAAAVSEDESPDSTTTSSRREAGLADLQAAWSHVLRQVRSRNVAVEALLKACEPVDVAGKRIVLNFQYSFHRDKVQEQTNRALIEEVIDSILGGNHSIHCVLGGGTERGMATSGSEGEPDHHDVGHGAPPSGGEAAPTNSDQTESLDELDKEDRLAAVADDPVVQAMVDQYGARVVDVQ